MSYSVVSKLEEEVIGISFGIFFIGLLVSLLSLGYEVFFWLKNGEWPHLIFYAVFWWLDLDLLTAVNKLEWQGIKKIIFWFFELPLSVGFLGSGAVLGCAFYVIFSPKD